MSNTSDARIAKRECRQTDINFKVYDSEWQKRCWDLHKINTKEQSGAKFPKLSGKQ